MERQREKATEISKELQKKTEKELEDLRQELIRLRELKKQRKNEEKAKESSKSELIEEKEVVKVDDVENRLNKIDGYLSRQMEIIREKTGDKTLDHQYSEYIESELQLLEKQILGEEGLLEKEISPYEQLLKEYPWLEEKRYEFMYTIPDKKKHPSDYESWKEEWAKVMFDYAKYAILHILYLRELSSEKPFSNFQNREASIKEIAEKLITQKIAKWYDKKKDKLRIYWKTLETWADEIYNWAYDLGKLEPIMPFEIRDANMEFSTLPKEELEKIYKILSKKNKAMLLKLDDGETSFKILLD
ncbi:MAG: hypothetical protein ACTSR8_00515 [Promethearchaeota archaeon]